MYLMDGVPLRDVPLELRSHSSVKKGEIGSESQRLFAGRRRLEIVGRIHNDMSACKE